MLSVNSAGTWVDVKPDPSTMTWGLQDISASDAGRTQQGLMYKMLVTQKRKLDLQWVMLNETEASTILKLFNPEYIKVRYWDALGNQFQIRTFYTGDRTAPLQWFQLPKQGTRYATVSFNIIER